MNKKIFITGEAKISSLLRNYISARMEADFSTVEGFKLNDNDLQCLKSADIIILLHEIGRCEGIYAEKNLLFTKELIQSLPQYGYKATIVYFTPRKNLNDSDEIRAMKFEGEHIIQDYCNSSGAKAVLYRMPELYGPCFENAILDRLITEGATQHPDSSYEFLHSDDFMKELYRMVNGAPALMGQGRFAHPAGAYFATEASLLKKLATFKNVSAAEIPDFPSLFEVSLYDYYLFKSKICGSCKIDGDTVLSSARFGSVQAVRLAPQEAFEVKLNGASGLRMLLLCGSIKAGDKTYCGDKSILRIDLTKDTDVVNVGESIAVVEIWSHVNS